VVDPGDPLAVQRALDGVKLEVDHRRQIGSVGDSDLVEVGYQGRAGCTELSALMPTSHEVAFAARVAQIPQVAVVEQGKDAVGHDDRRGVHVRARVESEVLRD